jgi:translocation and assembly module TamB
MKAATYSGNYSKNIIVQLKEVDVTLDRADVGLGWRSLLLEKEVHLSHADVRNLRIINKNRHR